jgi:hypothetical protein
MASIGKTGLRNVLIKLLLFTVEKFHIVCVMTPSCGLVGGLANTVERRKWS